MTPVPAPIPSPTPAPYCLHPAYTARPAPLPWDDLALSPADRLLPQREVYEFAHAVALAHLLASPSVSPFGSPFGPSSLADCSFLSLPRPFRILDIGCGSGAKLVQWFPPPQFETVGTEVGATLDYLRRAYPEREWLDSTDLAACLLPGPPPDLVLCADVIEHLLDPDLLLDFLARTARSAPAAAPAWLILSTPNRDSLDNHSGPPRNPCHAREWSMPEFRQYVESHPARFEIADHFHSARKPVEEGGATQVILCRMKEVSAR